ncbi:MAG TPA: ECF transporter S component [Candidatus Limnocylindrales bacterium]
MNSSNEPRRLWALDGRVAAYALIGAALYGLLGLFVVRLGLVALRPGFALVPFVGFAFGPIAGFATGFIGQGVVEGISGSPGYSWIHGVAAGICGLVAGLAPMYVARMLEGSLRERAIAGGIAGIVGSVVGGLVLLLPGSGGGALDLFVPQVISNAVISGLLVPAIVLAWEPIGESLST